MHNVPDINKFFSANTVCCLEFSIQKVVMVHLVFLINKLCAFSGIPWHSLDEIQSKHSIC